MQNEPIIHVNLAMYKEGDTYIAVTKTRIWPPLLAYLQWITASIQMPGYLTEGLGLTIINNLAIIAEGVLTDLIEEHVAHTGAVLTPPLNFHRDGWSKKVTAYNQLFTQPLENYSCYRSMECIIRLRNNIAHGRSHSEIASSIPEQPTDTTLIESENANYEYVRQYLIEKELLQPSSQFSNVNSLWQVNNAQFLLSEVKFFIQSMLDANESPCKAGIVSEWNNALLPLS